MTCSFRQHLYNTIVADTSFTHSKDEWQPIALQGKSDTGRNNR